MVNYGTSDLRFRNDNSYSIFMYTHVDYTVGSRLCKCPVQIRLFLKTCKNIGIVA